MSRRKKGLLINGWVCLDKPLEMTSTEAVSRVRRLFQAQKGGHAGTLDPLASGILPIALGEATKTVPFLMDAQKVYLFTIAWGQTTDTLDREGDVIATSEVRPTTDAVDAALPDFIGKITQIPPAYSAIKVDGQRAYDLARDGIEVELKGREVTIYDLVRVPLADEGPDQVTLRMTCGKGTYVRSVVRDLAEKLGTCAHVSALRRERVGAFDLSLALTLEKLTEFVHKGAPSEALLPVTTALDDIPALAVTAEDAFRLKQGRPIVLVPRQVEALKARLSLRTSGSAEASRTVSVTHADQIVALCEMRAGKLNPTRVFHLDVE